MAFAAAAVLFAACGKKSEESGLQGSVFPVGSGFGYSITQGGKLLIKQQTIPALSGNLIFCDSTDAQKVCNKVIEKISNRQNPAVTPQELQELKIKTKC